jgi:hypothetical protein
MRTEISHKAGLAGAKRRFIAWGHQAVLLPVSGMARCAPAAVCDTLPLLRQDTEAIHSKRSRGET